MAETINHYPQASMLEYTAREWDLEPWAIDLATQADRILLRKNVHDASTVCACLGMYIRERLGKMAVDEWLSICGIAILVATGEE